MAATPAFEARATVAVDSTDRVWVVWQLVVLNWGKDQGYVFSDRRRALRWRAIAGCRYGAGRGISGWNPSYDSAFPSGNAYQPLVV